jgi:lipoprotein
MNIYIKNRFLLFLVAAFIVLSGCDKNKPPIVDGKTKTILLPFGDTIRLYADSGDIIVFDSVFDRRAPYYDCSRFDLLDPHAILGFSLKKNGTVNRLFTNISGCGIIRTSQGDSTLISNELDTLGYVLKALWLLPYPTTDLYNKEAPNGTPDMPKKMYKVTLKIVRK